jgi:hypothetical protein
LKASGAVSPIIVVISNVAVTPPIFNSVDTFVFPDASDCSCTMTSSPLFTVDAPDCHDHPLILYFPPPPVTSIGVGLLIPDTMIGFDSYVRSVMASVTYPRIYGSGVVSGHTEVIS